MSVLQYQSRTIDLLIWSGIRPTGDTQLTPSLGGAGGGGQIVTGIQKLWQKFMKCLLQEVGTKLYAPTEGTQFVTRIRQGAVRTSYDLQQLFASSLVDVSRQLRSLVTAATPLDEQYASALLLQATLDGPAIYLQVQLTSQAGTTAVFIQPLSVSPSSRYNLPTQ